MGNVPKVITLSLETPCYTGSVQKLYDVPGHPELLISETTAGGSVFDVGTIFNIEGSDIGRASFRHLVFQELQDPEAWGRVSGLLEHVLRDDDSGIAGNILGEYIKNSALTHHLGMIDRDSGKVYDRGFPAKLSNLTLIKKYEVSKPERTHVMGRHFYDYKKYHSKDRYVIPLEYIVRLGITSGSSILRKFNALSDVNRQTYLRELGIHQDLRPWVRFDTPLVDLTTKYEPEDRNISRQEAALISGLGGEAFSRSLVMAVLGAYLLQQIFARMGLMLWDLKWEIARDGDHLIFVDTIDTDSVRVTMNITRDNMSYFVHFNKQAMRDYYTIMHPDWVNAIHDAKKSAAQTGRPFTEILSEGQKRKEYAAHPVVDEHFHDIQKQKFTMIQEFIQNQGGHRELREESERIAHMELDYYLNKGKRRQYEEINAVSLSPM